MRGFVLAGALALLGCGETPGQKAEQAYDLADAAQANARTALSKGEDHDSRITDLESSHSEQETEIAQLRSDIDSLKSEFDAYKDDSVQWHHKHPGQ